MPASCPRLGGSPARERRQAPARRRALTDIRPQIEIALQLEALHGDPIDD